jgi:hypothetical protein
LGGGLDVLPSSVLPSIIVLRFYYYYGGKRVMRECKGSDEDLDLNGIGEGERQMLGNCSNDDDDDKRKKRANNE